MEKILSTTYVNTYKLEGLPDLWSAKSSENNIGQNLDKGYCNIETPSLYTLNESKDDYPYLI